VAAPVLHPLRSARSDRVSRRLERPQQSISKSASKNEKFNGEKGLQITSKTKACRGTGGIAAPAEARVETTRGRRRKQTLRMEPQARADARREGRQMDYAEALESEAEGSRSMVAEPA
jgi:hypothetical protein